MTADPGREPRFTRASAWVVVYWVLMGCFILTAALNLLHVRGGFLTNHLADLTLPALLYVLARELAPGKKLAFRVFTGWVGRTPERAALVLFLASTATEVSQWFWPWGPFAGRFDPIDVGAYGLGLWVVYLADTRLQGTTRGLPETARSTPGA